jgi:glutamate racemase
VELIEQCPLPTLKIRSLLNPVIADLIARKVDVLVLGCTHYPFVAHIISELAGEGVAIIETGLPVAKQLKLRLHQDGLENLSVPKQESYSERVRFYTTRIPEVFKKKVVSLLGEQWKNVSVEGIDV